MKRLSVIYSGHIARRIVGNAVAFAAPLPEVYRLRHNQFPATAVRCHDSYAAIVRGSIIACIKPVSPAAAIADGVVTQDTRVRGNRGFQKQAKRRD
ncbi:hypothetical protein D3C87_1378940 [compost metagenome]